jgi:hypothetical protein
MPAVARTYAEVYPLAPQFGQRLTRQISPGVDKAAEETSKHFGRKFAAGLAAGAAIIGVGLYKATKLATRGILATTKAASALNEQTNKSSAIFGKNAKDLQTWARGARNAFGQSRTEALSAASAFGDIFLQLKIGQRPATNMSKRLVELASDLASFSDADITQVLEAQQAAFRGEYDSLQRFVPGIKAARVEQVALNQTHKASAKDLTDADKALATYKIMVEDTRRAHGDYAKTLETSVANQQRKAKAQWEDLKVTLGQGFLPAQLAVTRAFTEKLLPAGLIFVRELAPGIKETATGLAEGLTGAVPPAKELASTARDLGQKLEELGPDLGRRIGEGLGRLFDLLKQIGPELRNTKVQASDLPPLLRLSGELFGFVADHADTLARHLPLVVALFGAYKATQAAANTAALLSLPIKAAEVVANLALSRSNRALVASLGERAAATVVVTAAETAAVPTTTAWGAASATAASRTSLLAGALGVLGAALLAGDLLDRATDKLGKWKRTAEVALLGAGLLSVTVGGLKDSWRAMIGAQDAATTSMGKATTASDTLRNSLELQRQTALGLKDALGQEKDAELNLRQAKLNVATAQERLTQLTRDGKKGSNEYKQAQLDLKRAQIDVKGRTDEYKGAQNRANDAQRDARRAANQATGPYQGFGNAAKVAGEKAFLMGSRTRDGIALIPNSKTTKITASFGWQGLKVFRTSGGQQMLASGGPVWGAGTTSSDSIPARLSNQEHVWEAPAVRGLGGGSYQRGHRRLAALRAQARGYAGGGPVLDANFPSGTQLAVPIARFQANIERVLNLATERFKALANKLGGGPGIQRALAWARSKVGSPYVWGGVGPFGWDCSGFMSSITNVIMGRSPYSRLFSTGSFPVGGWARGFLPMGFNIGSRRGNPGHMAGTLAGVNVESRGSRGVVVGAAARGARDSLFGGNIWHLAGRSAAKPHSAETFTFFGQGGQVIVPHRVMDRGGLLPPRSMTLVSNRTARPEPVGLDYDALAEALTHVKVPVFLDRVKVSHELRSAALLDRRRH